MEEQKKNKKGKLFKAINIIALIISLLGIIGLVVMVLLLQDKSETKEPNESKLNHDSICQTASNRAKECFETEKNIYRLIVPIFKPELKSCYEFVLRHKYGFNEVHVYNEPIRKLYCGNTTQEEKQIDRIVDSCYQKKIDELLTSKYGKNIYAVIEQKADSFYSHSPIDPDSIFIISTKITDFPNNMFDFPGGADSLYLYLNKKTSIGNYGIKGTIAIEAEVNKNGKIKSARIVNEERNDITNSILSAIKNIPALVPTKENTNHSAGKLKFIIVFR